MRDHWSLYELSRDGVGLGGPPFRRVVVFDVLPPLFQPLPLLGTERQGFVVQLLRLQLRSCHASPLLSSVSLSCEDVYYQPQ